MINDGLPLVRQNGYDRRHVDRRRDNVSHKRHSMVGSGIALMLDLASQLPAQASMLKHGTKSCSNPTPRQVVHARTIGDTHIVPAPTGGKWYYTTTSYSYIRSLAATSNGWGYWYVWAEDTVYGPETYAYCTDSA